MWVITENESYLESLVLNENAIVGAQLFDEKYIHWEAEIAGIDWVLPGDSEAFLNDIHNRRIRFLAKSVF